MHIAICDDDALEIERIASFLHAYRQERNITLTYKTYINAAELLSTMRNYHYDLLILDILMPGFTGIQAAREVRGFDSNVKIVFFTSSPEFALDSYGVKASDYLLKPVAKENLFSVLDVIATAEQEQLDGITVKTKNGIARILFSKLAFIEVINKHLYFHMSDNSVREVYAPLSEYEGRFLARREFLKVHRSYIVNLWQMRELTSSAFISHNGITIPISRLLYTDVKRIYIEHLFLETGKV